MTATVTGLGVQAPDGTRILDGVDLKLRPGTVTALIGESGSGKTTLAQALLGHLGPGLTRTAGIVDVQGHDPFTSAGRKALRGNITAYLPQDPASALNPRRRLRRQWGATPDVLQACKAAALEPELLNRRPSALSGGQAQRALLAWTFLKRPELLILDEPTSGLDFQTARRITEAFSTLPWQPAVLVVTHDPDLIAADHVLRLGPSRSAETLVRQEEPGQAREEPSPGRSREPRRTRSLLQARDFGVERGGRVILRNVDLDVGEGEILAVMGRSGSGKTTLARTLSGLQVPTRGTVTLGGIPLAGDAATRARLRQPFVAYVGQDARAALNPSETAAVTLRRAADAAARAGRPPVAIDLRDFRLGEDVLERTPDRLSGGQRHRLALARALAASPHVLIGDETTAALDESTTGLVLDVLERWCRTHGTPIVLVTHTDRVAARADRVLTINGGRLL